MTTSILGKLYSRWADPTRPKLLPREDRLTARLAEIKNVRTWTSINVDTLLDVAYDVRLTIPENTPNWISLHSMISHVELDYYTWGVCDATCKRLVDECYSTYFF